MKCYCNRVGNKLMQIPQAAPANVTVDGKAVRILPDQNDNQTDAAQDYRFVTVMNVVGGTQPTAQLVIQGSVDGALWVDVAAGTSRTAAGLYTEIIDSANSLLLPWVRARLILGGTANPNVDLAVDIVSTGPFQLSNS